MFIMKEAPVYFYGPDDDVPSLDPYEEFIVEEHSDDEPEPVIEDPSGEPVSEQSVSAKLTVNDIVHRSALSLGNEASALIDMGPNFTDDLVNRMNEELSIEKNYFYDNEGTKHSKDKSLSFTAVNDIVAGVDSVFGVLCVKGGVGDLDFDVSFSTSALKDIFSNGMFSFAKCFIQKATTQGLHSVLQDALLASAINIISSDTPSAIALMNETLDPGIVELLNNDLIQSIVEKYDRPSTQPTLKSDLDKIIQSLDSVKSDWFINGDVRILDAFNKASADSTSLFQSDPMYVDSSIIAKAYDEMTQFKSFF